ncbi:M15 family metallopeptidase [Treponema zioleckii]|uniref:M15 family metallopeptidase n=1 Tax=Treponema zioleckii TaxID=331680 RepID=UPI00168B9EAB|nr:M15 family metallopeptidase [Treponema zioleckii]
MNNVLEEEKKFSKDDVSLYYLIDKKHNIGEKYVPTGLVKLVKNDLYRISRNDLSLRPDVEKALQTMAEAYKKETGDTLLVISTYRSYQYQKNLFQKWVAIDGLAEAERESAREGTSQHQLGSAIDFCELTNNFVNKPMGKWLNTHSEEYGWSLSFPKAYEDITGYRWECWHFRYIGIPACQLQKKYFLDVQQYMLEFIDFWKQDLKNNE